MTLEDTAAHPFDPALGEVPEQVSAAISGEDGGLVVLAVADSAEGGWAAEAAVTLARAWAQRSPRFFLADLGLDEPVLHRLLDLENDEGVTDVLLYGSQVRRVAQPADGGSFFFASAGTPTADVAAVLTHERWDGLVRGFRQASATLCIYLPLETPGAESVLARADRIVVLGGGGAGADLPAADRVVAVLAPPASREALVEEPAVEEPAVEEAVPGAVEPGSDVASPEAEREGAAGPVIEIEELAPDEAPDEAPVVEIDDLAPDEEPEVEAGVTEDALEESIAFGGEEPAVEEPAMEEAAPGAVEPGGDAAPPEAEEEGTAGPVVEIEALAPDEAPVVEIDELAPPEEPEAETGVTEDALEESIAFGDDEPPADEPPPEEPTSGEPAHGQGDWFEQQPDLDAGTGLEEEEPAFEEEADIEEEPVPDLPDDEGDEPFETGAGVEEEGEGFGAFDLGSFDTLDDEEADEVGVADDEVRIREDFGGDDEEPTVEEGGEPEEVDLLGGPEPGLPGEEEDVGGTEFAGEEEDAFDFGEFSGEMETVEEEPEEETAPSGDEEPAFEPPEDDAYAGEEPGEAGDFGADLVTGPDFGQGAPDDDWDDEEEVGPTEEIGHTADAELDAGDVPEELDRRSPVGTEREEREGGEAEGGEAEGEAMDRAPERSRGTGTPGWIGQALRVVVLVVLVVGGGVGLHWFGVVRVPGLDPVLVQVLGPSAVATTPTVDVGDPAPETPILGYSLAVDAYRDLASAAEVAGAWEESFSGFLFAVAPVHVEGDVFYRLLAGPAGSAEEAEGVMSALSERLTREDPSRWVVRATPLAFVLSEHQSPSGARAEAARLTGEGVPAYVLQVTYPGDTTRYRVYAGAYESGEEARVMKGILTQHGYDGARFTERRGVLPE